MAKSLRILARGFATSSRSFYQIENVTVIGGGQMGSGIAQVAAHSGQNVVVVDKNEKFLGKSKENIEKSLQRIVKSQLKKKGEDPSKAGSYINEEVGKVLSRISFTTDVPSSVKSSHLIIEAIIENLAIKQDLFQTIESYASENALLTTNTSSLIVSEIGEKLKKKDRFGGLHFFNPVPMMKLLEVVRTEELSDECYTAMMQWGQKIGKTCVTCKDTPGFVVNRLLLPLQSQALRLLEEGVASAKDIDTAIKLGAGHPMGPFELMDYTGLDVTKYVMDGWHQKYPDEELFKPSKIVTKLVMEGKYGVKTGEGFYKYKK